MFAKCATVCLMLVASAASAAETTAYRYDAQGRLIRVETTAPSAEPRITRYFYDAADNRTRVQACGANSSYETGVANIFEALSLYKYDKIESPNGRFRFLFQGQGNLVLYDLSIGAAIWTNHVINGSACRLIMQSDGNLVLFNVDDGVLWASNTPGQGASRLVVQDDGNMVIYRRSDNVATWSTGTYLR